MERPRQLTEAVNGSRRLDFLDTSRGIAAMLVLISHGMGKWFPDLQLRWTQAGVNIGLIGVILFLMISGFIIPTSLEQGGSNARFWLRRLFRLFPVYWLTILLTYVYLCGGGTETHGVALDETRSWLINLTMMQEFLAHPHVCGVFWTLSLELIIYASCSILFACGLLNCVHARGYLILVTMGAAVAILQSILGGVPFVADGYWNLFLAPVIGLFAQRYVSGKVTGRSFYGLLMLELLVVAAVWTADRVLLSHTLGRQGWRTLLIHWGIAAACFFLLLESRRWPMPLASCWLGRVSYSLYLLHPLVLALLPSNARWGPFAFGCLTLLLAAATHRWVELPAIALGRRIERYLTSPRQAADKPELRKAA